MKKKKEKKTKFYFYDVLVASNINQYLTYKSYNTLTKGNIVEVNLRNKKILGVIIKEVSNSKNNIRIKEIEKEYLDKIFNDNLMNFLNWVMYYNYLNAGLALKLFLPNKKTIELPATKSFYFSEKKHDDELSTVENDILKLLYNKQKSEKEIIKKYKDKLYLIENLKKKFVLENTNKQLEYNIDINKTSLKKLSKVQSEAYEQIKSKINVKNKKPIFLDGVTGSGKTEIYFKVIKDFLKIKKTNSSYVT